MNCSIFRKHINEYLNNEIFLEVREAMDDHLKSCRECRELYKEELYIDKLFKSALEDENISFRSSRSEIISNIDKKRYSNSPINKLKFSLAKNKTMLSAAVLAASLLLFILNSSILNFTLPTGRSVEDKTSAGSYNAENEVSKMDDSYANDTAEIEVENREEVNPATNSYEAFIEKLKVASEPYRNAVNEVKFNVEKRAVNEGYYNPSSWKNTSNNKYSALLDGKGEMLNKENILDGVREEGSSVIVVKNNETKESVNITLDSQVNQYTPLYIEWAKDGKLLVIVGFSQGTVVRGGDIYLLDTDTASSVLIYKADASIGEEAAVIEAEEEGLAIYLMKYLDNNKTTGIVDNVVLEFDEVTDEDIQATDKALIDLAATFNSKEAKKAEKAFLIDYTSNNLEEIGTVNEIESSKLISLRRINNFNDEIVETDYGIEDVATYLVEMDYNLSEGYEGPLKEGVNYQAVTIVKPIGEDNYKIADMFIVPSS